MVTNVPPDAVPFIRNDDVEVFTFPRRYVYAILLNGKRLPFSSPLVRRALNLAVNRTSIVADVMSGYGAVAIGPLWPQHWAYEQSFAGDTYNPQLSAQLLQKAGFDRLHVDSDARPPAKIRFTCLIPEGFILHERIALTVQKQLYEVGVDMIIDVLPLDAIGDRIQKGEFEAVLFDTISGPTLTRPYIFWRSSKTVRTDFNVFGYENPEAEKLFQQLFEAPDENAVRSTVRRLQTVLLEDPPAVFLAWQDRTRAIRREFRVVQEPGRDPLFTLWRWNTDNAENVASSR
jgi:peptide/nickel transport system substrate-binding protein